ncbi:hypothetical protein PPYR_08449 [Photinus pyralis]|uniref:Phosphatidylethanolamine-binding protein n=2 Tax=Photinus pyralis TaxID=7054 RepID=A0A5N4AJC9_PHOPY|nr:protein D2-like [Photinus pyralis]KAB0797455.1 hypothetical protein PPYR_08449 [Photinus pyralis]
MSFRAIVICVFWCFVTVRSCRSSGELSNRMNELGVIPDVIDKKPTNYLTVTYANNVKVNEGNELTPPQAKSAPELEWNTDPDKLYLLAMVDPDAPSRNNPKFREWQHWIVGNIPGCDVKKGDVISEYIGPKPPQGTGLHRYVLLVYQQPHEITFDEPKLSNAGGTGRGKFSIKKFAAKYNLGEPIAGNFYQAKQN